MKGATLGIVLATVTWGWLAAVDALAGHPFNTFHVLGGVVAFTVIHYLLNIGYGSVIMSAIRSSGREPSLAIALVFEFVMIEIAFAMITVLLVNVGLGPRAWVGVFGGSLIATMVAIVFLTRHHAFAAQLREADSRADG